MAADYEISKLERGKKKMTDEKNEAVTRAVDEVMAENETLKGKIVKLEKSLEEQTRLLAQANDYIANQKRADIILAVKKQFDVGDEFISLKSTDELKTMLEWGKLKKPPRFSSSGDLGGGGDPYEKLHTMFKFKDRKR